MESLITFPSRRRDLPRVLAGLWATGFQGPGAVPSADSASFRVRVDAASPLKLEGTALGLCWWPRVDLSDLAHPCDDKAQGRAALHGMTERVGGPWDPLTGDLLDTHMLFCFLSTMQVGDFVLLYEREGRFCRLAVLCGPYEFHRGERFPHRRPLQVLDRRVDRDLLKHMRNLDDYPSGWPLFSISYLEGAVHRKNFIKAGAVKLPDPWRGRYAKTPSRRTT